MAKQYLLEVWRDLAYKQERYKKQYNAFWGEYFAKEKKIYKEILKNPDKEVKGTVKELADQFGIEVLSMVGFLDGINDSLKKPNPIDKLTETTKVSLAFDPEKLYRNMVKAKADWLYGLEEWDDIIPEEKREEFYKEEKLAGTVIKDKKVGRNDPCPCGSGKKYKHCCGRA